MRAALATTSPTTGDPMNVLVIDVGGTHVKILASGETEKREFDSGPKMTAQEMVSKSGGSPATGAMTSCRSAIRARSCTIARSRIRRIWDPAGWVSISGRDSAGRSKSSTTRRCRRSAATRRARCCSSGSEPGSARRSSWTELWSRWSLVICLTRRPPMRTMSASGDWRGWARKGGASTFLTWLIDWSPRLSPTISCSAAATSGY